MLLISWFGARLIVGGSMTTGSDRHVLPHRDADPDEPDDSSDSFVMITMAKASASVLPEILDDSPACTIPQADSRSRGSAIPKFDDVSFSYRAMSASWRSKNVSHIKAGPDRRHSRRHRFRSLRSCS